MRECSVPMNVRRRDLTPSLPRTLTMLGVLIAVALPPALFAQMGAGGAGGNSELQQKLQAMRQAAAQNKQQLRHYQWTETQQVTLKGSQKPERVFQCSYGPDGQVQKIPMGAQPQQQQQKGIRGRIVEKKTEEMQDYMKGVQSLLALYVPPNAQLMQQAYQKHNVSIDKTMGTNMVNLVFKNYAKEGDQMTISFNPATKKLTNINVNTYMDNPQDVVTLAVQMATLQDGTNYAQQTVLNATQKQMQVTTSNSNYVKISSGM